MRVRNVGLTINHSTFTGNSATAGGGIDNYAGTSTISNSTFTGNSAPTGGGIYNYVGTSTISNSTFSGNSASSDGGGIFNYAGTIALYNTLLAGNTPANCFGTIGNNSHNLDDGTSCGFGSANGSLSSANPNLGSLTGSPAYFPLLPGSSAIDAGDNAVCAVCADPATVNNESQNGVTRPADGDGNATAICDIGSFELAPLIQASVSSSHTLFLTMVFLSVLGAVGIHRRRIRA